jgi:hypothetical protein
VIDIFLNTAFLSALERMGSFLLLAVVLWYFLARYERAFVRLERVFSRFEVRVARIEAKLEIEPGKDTDA